MLTLSLAAILPSKWSGLR